MEVRYRDSNLRPAFRSWRTGRVRGHFAIMEVAVTSRLRELIQQLGEAIHESVIESEQIAGVVQDIRKYGFDVLLMLEATIGLNEVSEKNAAAGTDETSGGEVGTFTPNDLHFLRSLRIAVEGEPDESATDVNI